MYSYTVENTVTSWVLSSPLLSSVCPPALSLLSLSLFLSDNEQTTIAVVFYVLQLTSSNGHTEGGV